MTRRVVKLEPGQVWVDKVDERTQIVILRATRRVAEFSDGTAYPAFTTIGNLRARYRCLACQVETHTRP
jgi:hypothetical protein